MRSLPQSAWSRGVLAASLLAGGLLAALMAAWRRGWKLQASGFLFTPSLWGIAWRHKHARSIWLRLEVQGPPSKPSSANRRTNGVVIPPFESRPASQR